MPLIAFVLLLVVLVIAVLLWPFALWLRYRRGRQRQRLHRWALVVRGTLLVAGTVAYLLIAWLLAGWRDIGMGTVLLALPVGGGVGLLGAVATRIERIDGCWWQTPNRWLLLAVTLLVVARAGWAIWHAIGGDGAGHAPAVLFELGAGLAGYGLGLTWGLYARLGRRPRA